ncbi:MAG: response regulator [Chloroflexota bacterium]
MSNRDHVTGPPNDAPAATPRLAVLVVEDSPVNMRLMRLILRARGHAVHEAADGEEALVFLTTHQPDIILLDMQLPGIDGFSLAARIKDRVETERIPIVAVTSYAMAGDEERALAAGCDAYLAKPIDDAELLATIERVTAKRTGRPGR